MKVKYDSDPLIDLYNYLNFYLFNLTINNNQSDQVINKILSYNECKINDDAKAVLIEAVPDTYLYFINGASGNEYNEAFDYISIYGSNYIVIFLDYFSNKKTKIKLNSDEMSIEEKLDYQIGNSLYVNAIYQIVNLFISIISSVEPKPGTVQDKINTIVPVLIAAKIINNIRPLQEEDVDGFVLPYEEIVKLIDGDISIKILGMF